MFDRDIVAFTALLYLLSFSAHLIAIHTVVGPIDARLLLRVQARRNTLDGYGPEYGS